MGKAIGNGFAVSALVGNRELMGLGGLNNLDRHRLLTIPICRTAAIRVSPMMGLVTDVVQIGQLDVPTS